MGKHSIYSMAFSKLYPMYVQKAEKKGRTKEEVDEIIFWLTGYDSEGLGKQIDSNCDVETFLIMPLRLMKMLN